MLVRRPQCAACGDPGFRLPPGRFEMADPRGKGFVADGGHRGVEPAETLRRYEHHVSAITGVVSDLHRMGTGLMGSVYASGPNAAQRPGSLSLLRRQFRGFSMGKGVSDAQARASALCEALERHSAVYRGEEVVRRASFRELGEEAVDPRSWLLISEAQYRTRERLNAGYRPFNTIPLPFDEDARIEWTPMWSLSRAEVRWVPAILAYFSYPVHPPEHDFGGTDSNGVAAGNTLEEALLQGFLELVERDAVALWWYNRVPRPGVDLASFDDPYLASIEERARREGRDLWVLDLTNDLGIPAFVAVSPVTGASAPPLGLGFGAHLEARIAVLRAVTEVAQFSALQGGGERSGGRAVPEPQWFDVPSSEPWMRPAPGVRARTAADHPRRWSDDLRDDVLLCRSTVEARGMELLALDLTRPDIGLPVVRVAVPGLRHFWDRFAPGRLYDVPVQLGWLPSPLSEDELNPVPMFV